MTPLDLRVAPPRPPRATLLGFAFLPRTIDKLRAELPGGHLGAYLNHDTGFSAWLVRRLGLEMEELRAAVAAADDEAALAAWLRERIDPAGAAAVNAKFETFVVERMSPEDQRLVRERHPVMGAQPGLSKMLDILEADDAVLWAGEPAADDEQTRFFRERGFGLALGFGVRPALLVIDMMKAFSDPSLPLGANLDTQIAATNRLLDAAHAVGAPVFFSYVAYDEPDCADAGIWGAKMTGLYGLTADSPIVALDERLHRAASDAVFVKKYASCFFGTDLVSRLCSRRIDTLIVAGCTTSGCVRASAVDAIQYGFRPIVGREAVGDRSQPAHDQSLFDIQAKYGDVLGVDTIVRELSSLGKGIFTDDGRARAR